MERAAAQRRIADTVGQPGRAIARGPLAGFEEAEYVLIELADPTALQRDMDAISGRGPTGSALARYVPSARQWGLIVEFHEHYGAASTAVLLRRVLTLCRDSASVTITDMRLTGIIADIGRKVADACARGTRYVVASPDERSGWLAQSFRDHAAGRARDLKEVEHLLSRDPQFAASLVALAFDLALAEAQRPRHAHDFMERDAYRITVTRDRRTRRAALKRQRE
ncbi:hypothetical protein HYS28_00970 [Candidatus Uhrbacteria bacterium]|nr:hypothetical protein [Candidatus Uhrbacteria bacterium]